MPNFNHRRFVSGSAPLFFSRRIYPENELVILGKAQTQWRI